ncbi:hypothetical protein [Actinokineospora iranica]|uniref:Uncharacterized protein n=1 Tax=Actinokineospora iranica TaxID=1271860 RepID=A0A1G6K3L0_9PSEU|nr:hypothetical protein [Actinokineospora iranica]SDC25642.1 hypothetical protein SAMN05216174_101701 [Actinokineospora iranica]
MSDTPPDPTSAAPVEPASPEGGTAPLPAPAGAGSEPDYKALYEAARNKITTAEKAAREARAKAKRLDEIEAAQQSEAEKAAARASAAENQVAALRRRAVDAEIRAAATGWADPTDAPRYLDDRDRYVSESGEIDTAAIAADLAAELARRPHLARQDGARRPAPDPSQGARQNGPAGLDAQITAAEKAGDWAAAIALKNQRLAQMPKAN